MKNQHNNFDCHCRQMSTRKSIKRPAACAAYSNLISKNNNFIVQVLEKLLPCYFN